MIRAFGIYITATCLLYLSTVLSQRHKKKKKKNSVAISVFGREKTSMGGLKGYVFFFNGIGTVYRFC